MADSGLVLITPTSIANTGGSSTASINPNGSVTFSACETLSLNGVFSSTYDNYKVVIRATLSTSVEGFDFRLRASGTDNSTANSYVEQSLEANGTSVAGGRSTRNFGRMSGVATVVSGYSLYLFGPFLTQATAWRATSAYGYLDASFDDRAGTHNQATSYDGITFDANMSASGRTITGLVSVYGFRQ